MIAQAESLMAQGQFVEARDLLLQITRSKTSGDVLADAYHMLGTIVQVLPQFGDGDECGLSYFKRSLDIDPSHVWANVGVLSTFGKRFPDHHDVEAVKNAIVALDDRYNALPDDVRSLVETRKLDLEEL